MSEDRRALLSELTIDRTDRAGPGPGGGVAWPLATLLVTLGIALGLAAGWWLNRAPAPVTVSLARVERVAAGGGGAPGQGMPQRQEAVLDATGYVTARRQATVSAEVTGRVVEVLVEEGSVVEEGQLLARLDDTLLAANVELAEAQMAAARAALEETRAQLREATRNLARVRDLQGRGLASDQELDAALAAQDSLDARLQRQRRDVDVAAKSLAVQQRQLDDMRIVAPFAGVVIDKAAQPGEMISPVSAGGGFTRTGICTLVDMESLEVEVDVNESYLERVTPGQPVIATLNSYPDWRIPAEVITIIPAADRNRATVRVRIALLERDARILPDMGVKVAFLPPDAAAVAQGAAASAPSAGQEAVSGEAGGGVRPGLYVPAGAVYAGDAGAVVFVVDAGRARARTVSVGLRSGGRRRVLDGVAEGELVVASVDDALARRLGNGAPIVAAAPGRGQ